MNRREAVQRIAGGLVGLGLVTRSSPSELAVGDGFEWIPTPSVSAENQFAEFSRLLMEEMTRSLGIPSGLLSDSNRSSWVGLRRTEHRQELRAIIRWVEK